MSMASVRSLHSFSSSRLNVAEPGSIVGSALALSLAMVALRSSSAACRRALVSESSAALRMRAASSASTPLEAAAAAAGAASAASSGSAAASSTSGSASGSGSASSGSAAASSGSACSASSFATAAARRSCAACSSASRLARRASSSSRIRSSLAWYGSGKVLALAVSQPWKFEVNMGVSLPAAISMMGISGSREGPAASRYSLAMALARVRSVSLAPGPIQTKIWLKVSSIMTSSSSRSSWQKLQTSSTRRLPVSVDTWKRRGGCGGGGPGRDSG
mmetsp:Transcript_8377/g.33050  ORF Transcript_8377/g.33050 Transcript_8377/m.33050 type:complete len:276 (+) Transcript_8377:363-1190(+)